MFGIAYADIAAVVFKELRHARFEWSPSEKVVARKAFNNDEASDLWNLESWLTRRHVELERKYGLSRLRAPLLFATLLTLRSRNQTGLAMISEWGPNT
jgi:hypothetical protein